MKRILGIFGAFVGLTLLAGTGLAANNVPQRDTVPEAFLDSLEANVWRVQKENLQRFTSMVVTEVLPVIDEENVEAELDTMFQTAVRDKKGRFEVLITDSQGEEKDRKKINPKKQRKKREGSNFYDPWLAKYRANYVFELVERDPKNRPVIAYRPKKELKRYYEAEAVVIDTTTWTPVSVKGYAMPTPKRMIKEMNEIREFSLHSSGHAVVSKDVTEIVVSILGHRAKITMTTTFGEYEFLP